MRNLLLQIVNLSPNQAIFIATLKNMASFHLPFSKTFFDARYIHLHFNIQINQPNVGK